MCVSPYLIVFRAAVQCTVVIRGHGVRLSSGSCLSLLSCGWFRPLSVFRLASTCASYTLHGFIYIFGVLVVSTVAAVRVSCALKGAVVVAEKRGELGICTLLLRVSVSYCTTGSPFVVKDDLIFLEE